MKWSKLVFLRRWKKALWHQKRARKIKWNDKPPQNVETEEKKMQTHLQKRAVVAIFGEMRKRTQRVALFLASVNGPNKIGERRYKVVIKRCCVKDMARLLFFSRFCFRVRVFCVRRARMHPGQREREREREKGTLNLFQCVLLLKREKDCTSPSRLLDRQV